MNDLAQMSKQVGHYDLAWQARTARSEKSDYLANNLCVALVNLKDFDSPGDAPGS